jgi:DNA polymerase-1
MPDYRSVRTIKEIKDYIGENKLIAFDLETSPKDKYREEKWAALDPHKSSITGISFSVREGTGVYLPLRHRVGKNVNSMQETIGFLANLLTDKTIIKIAHNLAFETMFCYGEGITIQAPCYDTIAASQLTLKSSTEFRQLKDSGLKAEASEFFDTEMPSFEAVTHGQHFDELDPEDPETIRYACADADFALRLYHLFNEWFDKFLPQHRFICEEIESPTAIYVGLMKYNGILVDEELMRAKQEEAAMKLQEIKKQIAFMIGDVDLGANASTAEFKNYLYKDLNLPVLKTTETFKEAADDEALILLGDWCKKNKPELVPLFELIQAYRKWGKLKSTYIDGYLDHVNAVTGRIHPSFFPLGTETGRFASRNPNLQNTPRKDNDLVGVRNFIIAPEGSVLLSLDFSQIELRVGAFYCRDKKMLETYKNDGDIHAQTTSVIFKVPFEEAMDKHGASYKERRSIAKNCNFGVCFGLFAKGLQRNLQFKAGLDTTLQECEEIIRNLKQGYPGLTRWQNAEKQKAALKGYTENSFGRRRYLPGINSPDWGKKAYAQRCALNTPIQGTAADILKLALGRIVAGLPERRWLKPLLQIHDELVFEVPVARLEEAVRFVKSCMEQRPFETFDVPIVAESTAGPRFGELEELA